MDRRFPGVLFFLNSKAHKSPSLLNDVQIIVLMIDLYMYEHCDDILYSGF